MKAPVNERKTAVSITLNPSLLEFARDVGRGNISYGIRYILQQAYIRANEGSRAQSSNSLSPGNSE